MNTESWTNENMVNIMPYNQEQQQVQQSVQQPVQQQVQQQQQPVQQQVQQQVQKPVQQPVQQQVQQSVQQQQPVHKPEESSTEKKVKFNDNNIKIKEVEDDEDSESMKLMEKKSISVENLLKIRKLIEVSNERCKWRIDEFYPIGLIINSIDECLKSESL